MPTTKDMEQKACELECTEMLDLLKIEKLKSFEKFGKLEGA
jgi:hypothetical protein